MPPLTQLPPAPSFLFRGLSTASRASRKNAAATFLALTTGVARLAAGARDASLALESSAFFGGDEFESSEDAVADHVRQLSEQLRVGAALATL